MPYLELERAAIPPFVSLPGYSSVPKKVRVKYSNLCVPRSSSVLRDLRRPFTTAEQLSWHENIILYLLTAKSLGNTNYSGIKTLFNQKIEGINTRPEKGME